MTLFDLSRSPVLRLLAWLFNRKPTEQPKLEPPPPPLPPPPAPISLDGLRADGRRRRYRMRRKRLQRIVRESRRRNRA